VIDALDTEADQVAGGAGNDSARIDSQIDTAWNIENYLTNQPTGSTGTLTVGGSGSTITGVPGGALNLGGGASNGGSGSIQLIGGPALGNGTISGVAQIEGNASGIDQMLITSDGAANTFTLSGNTTLNLTAMSGFTVGTYRLITVSDFTQGGLIMLNPDTSASAFNYSIVDPGGTISLSANGSTPIAPEAPAADPAVIVLQEPAIADTPVEAVVSTNPDLVDPAI